MLRVRLWLKLGTLGLIALGLFSSLLFLNYLSARAAPPAQEPINIAEIYHACQTEGLAEVPLNDTYISATLLIPGAAPVLHTLDSGGIDDTGEYSETVGTFDKDWFEFAALSGQAITLTVDFPGSVISGTVPLTEPLSNALTTTQIALYTSAATAMSQTPAVTSDDGQLFWGADPAPVSQTFWVRVVNPYAAGQDPTTGNDFCDYAYTLKAQLSGKLDPSQSYKKGEASEDKKTITYTIVLKNAGEPLPGVVVTDTMPSGVELESVTTSPPQPKPEVVTTTESLTWTGTVTGYGSTTLTLKTAITGRVEDGINVAWIDATEKFTVASGALDLGGGIFLPIILKSAP
jgi:uncharacterized repeat protein (TIGR01451 family)